MTRSLSLGALSATQLILSFLLQVAVLAALGAGTETDAWVAAQAAPLILLSVFSAGLQAGWQARLAVTADDAAGWRAGQRAAQGQMLLLFGSAALVAGLTSPAWTQWVFPGFNAEQLQLTVRMNNVLLAGAVLNGHSALLTTALRGREQFVLPEVVMAAGGAFAIVATSIALREYGVEAAAWVALLRAALVCMVLFLCARRPWPDPGAAAADADSWKRLRPLLLGSSIYKMSPLVDRFWSSFAPAGGMTTFNLVLLGMGSIATVLERALAMPVAPLLARLAAAGDLHGLQRAYRRAVLRTASAALAVLVVIILTKPFFAQAAAPLLKTDESGLQQAWLMCVVLAAYLTPAAAGSAVMSSFYAMNDVATPMRIAVGGFAASVALKSAGFLAFGLTGLAAAHVAHYLINFAILTWLLERRLAAAR